VVIFTYYIGHGGVAETFTDLANEDDLLKRHYTPNTKYTFLLTIYKE